jgi:hypothetical protein
MNTQEQAYINGFVKRANQYGLTTHEAVELYKIAWSMENLGARAGDAIANAGMRAGQNVGNAVADMGRNMTYASNVVKGLPAGFAQAAKDTASGIGNAVGNAASSIGNRFKSMFGASEDTPGSMPTPAQENPLLSAKPSNPFGGEVNLGITGKSSPAPAPISPEQKNSLLNSPAIPAESSSAAAPAAAPAAPAAPAQAAAPAGPSDAFLKKIMGSYNPNSKVDQAQADRVRQLYAQGKTTAKDIYASPEYKINREALGARQGSNASAYR